MYTIIANSCNYHHITFTPTLYEQTPHLNLLTWGSPLLTRLLTHLNP